MKAIYLLALALIEADPAIGQIIPGEKAHVGSVIKEKPILKATNGTGGFIMMPQTTVTIAGGRMWASGLVMESGSSLLDYRNLTVDGPATVKRYIDNSGTQATISWDWHLLSSPVAAQAIWTALVPTAPPWALVTNWDFYYWNPNTPAVYPHSPWVNIKNSAGSYNNGDVDKQGDDAGFGGSASASPTMTAGRGYLVGFDDEDTKIFSGTLNTGEVTLNVTNTADYYCMAGNPYPSSLDWMAGSGWTRDNLATSGTGYDYWIYNEDKGGYGVFNSGSGYGTNDVTRLIAPTQGFFVKAGDYSSSTPRDLLIMNNSARVHSSQGWLKSGGSYSTMLRLKITSNQNAFSDEMIIDFNTEYTGAEGSDKFMAFYAGAPEIWSVKNTNSYSIDRYRELRKDMKVNISAKCGTNGTYTITADHTGDFALSNIIYLKDLKTGISVNLKENNSYSFTGGPNDNKARFELSFAEILGLKEPVEADQITVFVFGKDIYLDASLQTPGNYEVYLYDAIGRIIYRGNYTPASGRQKFTTLNIPGVYVIKMISLSGAASTKIIIP